MQWFFGFTCGAVLVGMSILWMTLSGVCVRMKKLSDELKGTEKKIYQHNTLIHDNVDLIVKSAERLKIVDTDMKSMNDRLEHLEKIIMKGIVEE